MFSKYSHFFWHSSHSSRVSLNSRRDWLILSTSPRTPVPPANRTKLSQLDLGMVVIMIVLSNSINRNVDFLKEGQADYASKEAQGEHELCLCNSGTSGLPQRGQTPQVHSKRRTWVKPRHAVCN